MPTSRRAGAQSVTSGSGFSPSSQQGTNTHPPRNTAALGARLEIRLLATEDPARARSVTRRDLLLVVRPLFWDVDLTSAHLDAHSQWVLRRVLQFGNREQVTHARLYYGDEAVRNTSRHRSMDLRTRRLWQVLLPEETDPR